MSVNTCLCATSPPIRLNVNLFQDTELFLYLPEASENLWFPGDFLGGITLEHWLGLVNKVLVTEVGHYYYKLN